MIAIYPLISLHVALFVADPEVVELVLYQLFLFPNIHMYVNVKYHILLFIRGEKFHVFCGLLCNRENL